MEREPQDKKLFCRWGELAFVLGTFFIALGVSLMEKGGLGMSMVTSQSYIISLAVPFLTFGMADYMLQGLLLIGYYIIVRRFDWKNILSFFSAFIFGVVLDGIMWVMRDLQAATLVQRILFFAMGMLINSLGVALFFQTYLPLQVYELFVTGIVERFGWKLHRVKTCFPDILREAQGNRCGDGGVCAVFRYSHRPLYKGNAKIHRLLPRLPEALRLLQEGRGKTGIANIHI